MSATTDIVTGETRDPFLERIRRYWDEHIHDLAVARHPVGTRGFFKDLSDYRFDKLRYLPKLVDFNAYAGKRLLEVGCGLGIDLARFAKGGAHVAGVDISARAIELARANLDMQRIKGDLRVMDGESMDFADGSFDVVYAHGVLQYTAEPRRMVREALRVLRPGGEAIFMVYNRHSWLSLMSRLFRVPLEHTDAPALRTFSTKEFRRLLRGFCRIRLVPERFPVKSRLHGGWKGFLYNTCFVGAFNAMPRRIVRPFGWHLMAFAKK